MNLLIPVIQDIARTGIDDLAGKSSLREFCSWLDEQIKLIPRIKNDASMIAGLELSTEQKQNLSESLNFDELQKEIDEYHGVEGIGVMDDLEKSCFEVFQDQGAALVADQIMFDEEAPPEGPTIDSASIIGGEIYKVVRGLISARYIDYAIAHEDTESFMDFSMSACPVGHQMEDQNKADSIEALKRDDLSDAAISNLMTIASYPRNSGTNEPYCRKIKEFYLSEARLDDNKAMADLSYKLRHQASIKHYARDIQKIVVPKLISSNVEDLGKLVAYLMLLDLTNNIDSRLSIDQELFDKLFDIISYYRTAFCDESIHQTEDCLTPAMKLLMYSDIQDGINIRNLDRNIVDLIKRYNDNDELLADDIDGSVEKNLAYCFAILYNLPELGEESKSTLRQICDEYNYETNLKMSIASAAFSLLKLLDGENDFLLANEIESFGTRGDLEDIQNLARLGLIYKRQSDSDLHRTIDYPADRSGKNYVPLLYLSVILSDPSRFGEFSQTELESALVRHMLKAHRKFSFIEPGTTEEDFQENPCYDSLDYATYVLPQICFERILDEVFTNEISTYTGSYREFSASVGNILNRRGEDDDESFKEYLAKPGKLALMRSALDGKYAGWQNHTQEYLTQCCRTIL